MLFDLGFRFFCHLACPHGGSPSSHLILRFVFSQLHVTLWARMSGFLHVIHAEGDKAARPTSNEAKNHCNQELQIKDLEIPNSEKVLSGPFIGHSRFIVQVGHHTTYASSRYHHFFTTSRHHQTYQNY